MSNYLSPFVEHQDKYLEMELLYQIVYNVHELFNNIFKTNSVHLCIISGCAGSPSLCGLSSCGPWVPRCGGCCCRVVQALGRSGLGSGGTWA